MVKTDVNIFLKHKIDHILSILFNLFNCFTYIDPPARPNGFLLSNIPASCSQGILYTIFGEFGNIYFQWVDDTHCWLTVKDDKKVSKVPSGSLRNSKLFSAYMEGGKKHQVAIEKNITLEIGCINIQSWNSWIGAIVEADLEIENVSEELYQDVDETMVVNGGEFLNII